MDKMDKKWTLAEARQVLPEIIRITERAVEESSEIVILLDETILPEAEQEFKEDELSGILDSWARMITKMGAEIKGLWTVDFDNGQGYYCWKYGETDIAYQHSYDGGYKARRPLAE